jgi:hypothetical protein
MYDGSAACSGGGNTPAASARAGMQACAEFLEQPQLRASKGAAPGQEQQAQTQAQVTA